MSEITYIIIPADSSAGTTIRQCTFADSYTVMRDTVGGFIELVSLRLADMFINEEGKLYDLPVNPRATRLAWTDRAISFDDVIVGDVIVFGKANADGDETSITPEFRTHMLNTLGGKA